MMKRFLACLVAVACLLSAFALAEGSLSMRVIKCTNRVNIRQNPNTDSAIVGQAPLGAVLVGCQPAAKGSEWYAVVYDGVAGYIRGDFLELIGDTAVPVEGEPAPDAASGDVPEYDPAEEYVEDPSYEELPFIEEPAEEAAPVAEEPVAEEPAAAEAPAAAVTDAALPAVENAPIAAITDESGLEGDAVILEADVNGRRIVARRIYQEEREYLAVAALDAEGNQIWKQETATSGITELTLTDAFIGGIAARPLVMVNNAELGLYALDPDTGAVRWMLPAETVHLGGSLSYAVGGMGVTYIGGYYGPDPVAIDANGRVLWQAHSGSADIYWLEGIELRADGLACAYGSVDAEGTSGTVVYDYNGAVVEIVNE